MKTTEQKLEIVIKILKLFRPMVGALLSQSQLKQLDSFLEDLR